MAQKAVVGKDRANIAVELDPVGHGGGGGTFEFRSGSRAEEPEGERRGEPGDPPGSEGVLERHGVGPASSGRSIRTWSDRRGPGQVGPIRIRAGTGRASGRPVMVTRRSAGGKRRQAGAGLPGRDQAHGGRGNVRVAGTRKCLWW